MSTASERSFGEELVRIIRAEICKYDERKDEAVRLRRVADEAVAQADRAATNARDSKPGSIGDVISAAFVGDVNAQAIDALMRRQQHSHVDFTIGGNKREHGVVRQAEAAAAAAKAANDELLRSQQQSDAEKTTAWKPRGTGENLPRRRWWRHAKG